MKLEKFAKDSVQWLVLVAVACVASSAATRTVTTVAGGYVGDGNAAISASLALPNAVARDTRGNIYVSDSTNCRIRKINSAGRISTLAGTGICGYSGDGGAATSAMISNPYGVALDRQGDLIIADGGNARIRKITPVGIITTIAGNGTSGYSGDGGPATQASLSGPLSVALDASGQIYLADTGNNVIRRVDIAGIIHTVAGNHTAGFSGDGGPATSASFNFPWNVAVDGSGNFYLADINNNRVRRVDTTGTINTYAGNGSYGNSGSGGLATAASIGPPRGLLIGGGKLYFSTGSQLVWVVDLKTQIITIIAGSGNYGYNGDGNSALSTSFAQPNGIAFDGVGGLLFADSGNNRVRHIDANGIVSTSAGGAVGDGGRGTGASLNFSFNFVHASLDAVGNLYIADSGDCRVRKVTKGGTISTLAGTGICSYTGDGGKATAATLAFPTAAVADGGGNVYIADTGNSVIRKVDSSGTITTFLTEFSSGNNGESARVVALAIDAGGTLYASDGIYAVWKVGPSGSTTVVAGTLFNLGYNGDGIPATQAWLFFPTGIAVDNAGNLYIADWLNNRVRKVDTSGIISTAAGNGTQGFGGDGGPATSAMLSLPSDVAVDAKGNFYIADWINFRVRVVNASGIIQTLAGSGGYGYNGEGLPATQANVFPSGVAVGPNGTVYFADQSSYRVRTIH